MAMVIKRMHAFPEEYIEHFNRLRDKGTEWDVTEGTKFLAHPDNALFLAFIDDHIVGFLTGYRLQRLDKRKAEILLYEVAVAPHFRNKGVGKALLQHVKDWAKESDAHEVWVLTNRSNTPAVALYRSAEGTTESEDEQMFTFKL